jgi:hypothetical protein
MLILPGFAPIQLAAAYSAGRMEEGFQAADRSIPLFAPPGRREAAMWHLLHVGPRVAASRFIGCAALCVIVYAPLLHAANFNPSTSADTFVFAGEPNSNYGAAGQLAISDAGRPQGEFQSLMRFDLAPAKASFDAAFGAGQWTLQSATLRLSTGTPNNPIFNANLAGSFAISWMQNDSWVEGTGTPVTPTNDGVTFATLPSFLSAQDQALGSFSFPGGNTGNNTYTLNLTSGLANDALAGDALSLRLFADAGMTLSYGFASRSFATTTNRPVLTLTATAVPEPATAGAAATLLGLVASRRRARKQ